MRLIEIGVGVCFLLFIEGMRRLHRRSIRVKEAEITDLKVKKSELEIMLSQERAFHKEKMEALLQAKEQLKESFQSLSFDALEKNHKAFLHLAKKVFDEEREREKGSFEKKEKALSDLLHPLKNSLKEIDQGMRSLEKERKGDREAFKESIRGLLESEGALRKETANLTQALKKPTVRGRWGEIQLKRVVELSGMLSHCDFYEQTMKENDQKWVRPDLIVKLPGNRQIIVDAKVPFESFLEAQEVTNEKEKERKMQDHARLLKQHVVQLGKKAYFEQFVPTPEFVVLFLPLEAVFSAALEYEPSLIETAASQGVIIATPTTLIALLKAVSYGWKQDALSENAREISQLGHELYKRVGDMNTHLTQLGRAVRGSVDSYNRVVGSFESRVLVSARKLKELGSAPETAVIEPPEEVEKIPRQVKL